jgi:hypothetical protein
MNEAKPSYSTTSHRDPQRQISYTDDALQSDIERIRGVWGNFQSSRQRDAVFEYLTEVYNLVGWWEAEGKASGRARRALKYQPGEGGIFLEPFSAVIYCTSNGKSTDKKTRSKFARVLRYAAAYKLDAEPLKKFIKRKGGLNACAARYARRLGRRVKTR